MRQIVLLPILLGLISCSVSQKSLPPARPDLRALEAKMEPDDHFQFARMYPDTALDWRLYHRKIEQLRERETALRRGDPCTGTFQNWALQGPANIGGRVNTLVVKPDNEQVVLAGFSAGGIFKSDDGGTNWRPVFDDHLNLSIGDLTFDPSNPNVVYVGTGDPNMPGYTFNGSGIFKSTDAGETWAYLGLADVGIISKIEVNPTDPLEIFVASMGNPFARGPERGIWKTTDGGATWTHSLFFHEQAGASDLIMNPQNPNVLYASFWDRVRTSTESVVAGDHARVFKTVDSGKNWTMLDATLPTYKLGRTGLAMSKQNPQTLYVVFVDSMSARPLIFKTTDGGNTWNALNTIGLHSSYGDFGWYFGKVRLNPTNDDDLYFLAVQLWRKAPGSTQFSLHGGMHADVHDLVFTPSGVRFTGTDGGVYKNNPGQGPWPRAKNLPTTQFYAANFNKWKAGEWYGGAQDNGIVSGSSTVLNDWVSRVPGDGFTTIFSPVQSSTIWTMTQNGQIWYSVDAGDNWILENTCLGTMDRCGWNTPFFVSQHPSDQKLYAASHRVMASDANGQPSWVLISGDLTDGNIYGPRFHVISALGESPVTIGKLMAGTSDGNVWRRDPSGTWVNVSAGLPNRYVSSVVLSPTQSNRLFVTHAGWRSNDYIPHIHRSDDNGQTWVDISGDLPEFPVNDLIVLPFHADSVLIVATDVGVYFSKNRGQQWERLGKNLPNVPCYDLERNPLKKEIGVATYARGLWTYPIDSLFKQVDAPLISLSGRVQTALGDGVKNVEIGTTKTPPLGTFSFQNLPACESYTLTPYRNDNPQNGVSSFDLLLISKHILNTEPLDSPLKILAADVNRSRTVTTADIVPLRRLILGVDTAFANNTSWRFVPKNFTFKHPNNPFLDTVPESITVNAYNVPVNGLDFIGYKIGDMNLSATPNLNAGADDRELAEKFLFLENQRFKKGEIVETSVSAELSETDALQFSLRFDPSALEFLDATPLLDGVDDSHFGKNRLGQGLLSFCSEKTSWGNFETGKNEKAIFNLRFLAKKDGELASVLAAVSKPTAALAFENGVEKSVVLKFKNAAADGAARIDFQPTVFGSGGTTARIFDRSGGLFSLQIVDSEGKVIFKTAEKPAGELAEIAIPGSLFSENGSYFYRVGIGGREFSGKLIFQK